MLMLLFSTLETAFVGKNNLGKKFKLVANFIQGGVDSGGGGVRELVAELVHTLIELFKSLAGTSRGDEVGGRAGGVSTRDRRLLGGRGSR